MVSLIRLNGGELGCVFYTGHAGQAPGEQYFWGMRWRRENLGASIVDTKQAIAGPSITIVVDNVPVGNYTITRRIDAPNGFQNAVAEFSSADSKRMLNLLSVGGTLQFATNGFTYSASLQGAPQALGYLNSCIAEAIHLDASATK